MNQTPHERAYDLIAGVQGRLEPILQPLFSCTDIEHFGYYKIFDDGSYFKLANCLEWQQFFFETMKDLPVTSQDQVDQLTPGKTSYFNWPVVPRRFYEDGWSFMYHKMRIWNGFNIIIAEKEAIEVFAFSTSVENVKINDYYPNHLDLLTAYTGFFKSHIPEILGTRNEEEACFAKTKVQFDWKKNKALQTHGKEKSRKLKELIQGSQMPVLRPREKDCLGLLSRGQSFKQIAFDLGLSVRTVEHYLENARKRNGFKTSHELLCKYIA